MATTSRLTIRLDDGGAVSVADGPDDGSGSKYLRLEVLQRFRTRGADAFVLLRPGEAVKLVEALAQQITGVSHVEVLVRRHIEGTAEEVLAALSLDATGKGGEPT